MAQKSADLFAQHESQRVQITPHALNFLFVHALFVPASARIAQAMWQYVIISFAVIVAVFCRRGNGLGFALVCSCS